MLDNGDPNQENIHLLCAAAQSWNDDVYINVSYQPLTNVPGWYDRESKHEKKKNTAQSMNATHRKPW